MIRKEIDQKVLYGGIKQILQRRMRVLNLGTTPLLQSRDNGENFDAMGIHTGDSITVAPAQTLTDKEYQIMRNASMAVLREIGVETGGSNVQRRSISSNGGTRKKVDELLALYRP
jgi:hypothetical protein